MRQHPWEAILQAQHRGGTMWKACEGPQQRPEANLGLERCRDHLTELQAPDPDLALA